MDNFYYLIASLPELSPEWKGSDTVSIDTFLEEIRENCSAENNKIIDLFLEGCDETTLGHDFYVKALKHKNKFIREYFDLDLHMRNAKVKYLNKELGREPEKDLVWIDFQSTVFDEETAVNSILQSKDILARERALDDILWNKIDEITTFDYFNIDTVLGFLAKLNIIYRWLKLDEQEGKKMFKKLIDDIRGTYESPGERVL